MRDYPSVRSKRETMIVNFVAEAEPMETITWTGDAIEPSDVKKLSDFMTRPNLIAQERLGREPIPSLRAFDEKALLMIFWDTPMVVPDDLDLIQVAEYAILEEDPLERLRRRALARRREWFDTNQQYLQYLLVVEAIEIVGTTLLDDGE